MTNPDRNEAWRLAWDVRSVLCGPLYVEIVASLVGLLACYETAGAFPRTSPSAQPLYIASLVIALVGLVIPPGRKKTRLGVIAVFLFNLGLGGFPATLPATESRRGDVQQLAHGSTMTHFAPSDGRVAIWPPRPPS
jgi:hypothetical protein